MSKGIYISSAEPRSGKSVIVLGIMEMLAGQMGKAGFFRPVVRDEKTRTVSLEIGSALPRPFTGLTRSFGAKQAAPPTERKPRRRKVVKADSSIGVGRMIDTLP